MEILSFPDHSCPPSSLVSPKREAGTAVGVGMLRDGGDSLKRQCNNLGVLVYLFSGFLASQFLGFLVSEIQSFKVSKFRRPKNDFVFVGRYWSHITKLPFHLLVHIEPIFTMLEKLSDGSSRLFGTRLFEHFHLLDFQMRETPAFSAI